MTDYEFTQTMREVGYEVSIHSSNEWYYKKNHNFLLLEYKHSDACELVIDINADCLDNSL